MSRPSRLHKLAIGGCLAAFQFLAIGALAQQTGADNAAVEFRPTLGHDEAQAALDAEVRQRTEQAAKDDLLAQQSMARSTEDLVDLTRVQIRFSFVETILLVATTMFTAIAAWAAVKAAKSATDATKLAGRQFDHFVALERPWLYVGVLKALKPIDLTGDEQTLGCVQFNIYNHGRLPGAIVEWQEYVGYGQAPGDPLFNESRCVAIGPNERLGPLAHDFPVTIGGTIINLAEGLAEPLPAKSKGERIFSRFVFEYRGPTGLGYEAAFCFVYDHAIGGWRPHYGVPADKYNYHREKIAT